jgi:hypothetical protein
MEGHRSLFYWDDVPGRRRRPELVDSAQAEQDAKAGSRREPDLRPAGWAERGSSADRSLQHRPRLIARCDREPMTAGRLAPFFVYSKKLFSPTRERTVKLKTAGNGLAALGTVVLTAGSASALPNGLPHMDQFASQAANVEQVVWVCNDFGPRFWRPGPTRGAWGPSPAWGPGWSGWGPGWGGAYAWGAQAVWRPQPVWGSRPWGAPPGPRWGWNGGWW